MDGKFLLDTSVVVVILGGDDFIPKQLGNDNIYIPSIVIGELYFGAYKSRRVADNLIQMQKFVAENSILDCDSETARRYGSIKESLRKKGFPIPDNDIMIYGLLQSRCNIILCL